MAIIRARLELSTRLLKNSSMVITKTNEANYQKPKVWLKDWIVD